MEAQLGGTQHPGQLAAGGAPLAAGPGELASGADDLAAGAGTFAASVGDFGDGVAVYTYGIDRGPPVPPRSRTGSASWFAVALGTSTIGVARSRTIPLNAVLAR